MLTPITFYHLITSVIGGLQAFMDTQLLADTLHKTWPEAEGLPEAADIRGQLAVPPDPNLGDYAFPCFRFAKVLRMAPPKIAEAIGLTKWVTEAPIVKTLLDAGYPDRIYCVSDEEARAMANRLCQEEGIFCGMSSGANVAVALRIAKELGPGKNVVTTIVDRRDRYLSETPYEKYVV